MDICFTSKEILKDNTFAVLMSGTNATSKTFTVTQEHVDTYKKLIVLVADGGSGTPNPKITPTGTITEVIKTTTKSDSSYASAKGGICSAVYKDFIVGTTIKGTGALRISFIVIGIEY